MRTDERYNNWCRRLRAILAGVAVWGLDGAWGKGKIPGDSHSGRILEHVSNRSCLLRQRITSYLLRLGNSCD